MKTIVLVAGLICALCLFQAILAAPAGANFGEDEIAHLAGLEQQPLAELFRQKRDACDLWRGPVIKHFACAIHCVGRRKIGGYCNVHGVCECGLDMGVFNFTRTYSP